MAFTKEEREEIKLITKETINEIFGGMKIEFEKRQRAAEKEAMKDPTYRMFKDVFGNVGVVKTSNDSKP